MLQLFGASVERSGMDRAIGVRVPRMLRELGLVDVRVNPFVHAYPLGHPRRQVPVVFAEAARPRLLEQGLVQEAEIDALIDSLRRHLAEPGTLYLSSVFVQAWGRVPGAAA
jgi:hypothetical protein